MLFKHKLRLGNKMFHSINMREVMAHVVAAIRLVFGKVNWKGEIYVLHSLSWNTISLKGIYVVASPQIHMQHMQ